MKLLAAAGTRQFTARPASIGCLACHGQYFAASLPIHQKSCFQRNAFELIPCEKCRTCIRAGDFLVHTASCTGKPRPLHDASRPSGANQYSAVAQGVNLPEMDGRVRCRTCERAFSQDRIAKHQSVCHGKPRAVKENHEPRRRSVIPVGQAQAASSAAVKRAAAALRRKTIHAQRPAASRFREVSLEFAQGGNAGRSVHVGRDVSGRQACYPGAQRMQAGGVDVSNASSTSNPLVTNPLMAARR